MDFILLTGAFFAVLYLVLTLLLCVVSLTSVGGTRSGDEAVKLMFLSSWAPLRARILWHPVEFQVTLLLQTSFNCAFSFGRGMSRGKVIRLRRRKQDNVSGELEGVILIAVTFAFFLQDLCLLAAVIISLWSVSANVLYSQQLEFCPLLLPHLSSWENQTRLSFEQKREMFISAILWDIRGLRDLFPAGWENWEGVVSSGKSYAGSSSRLDENRHKGKLFSLRWIKMLLTKHTSLQVGRVVQPRAGMKNFLPLRCCTQLRSTPLQASRWPSTASVEANLRRGREVQKKLALLQRPKRSRYVEWDKVAVVPTKCCVEYCWEQADKLAADKKLLSCQELLFLV